MFLVQDELLKKTKLARARGTAFRKKRSEDCAEGMASLLDSRLPKGSGVQARSANSLWSRRPDGLERVRRFRDSHFQKKGQERDCLPSKEDMRN